MIRLPRAAMTARYATCIAGCAVFAALGTTSSSASALDLDVGVRIGGNFNMLSRPVDPVGEPTLLHGSAFSGFGFTMGAAVGYELTRFSDVRLTLEGDLLYSFHSGTGFAEYNSQRREATISTHTVRLPVLVSLSNAERSTGLRIGAGLELIAGMASSSEVTEINTSSAPEPLHTQPASHVVPVLALAVDYHQPTYTIPLELRVTWNPFVGVSTVERFDGYQSYEQTGYYRVAFNWQAMFLTGFSWGMSL